MLLDRPVVPEGEQLLQLVHDHDAGLVGRRRGREGVHQQVHGQCAGREPPHVDVTAQVAQAGAEQRRLAGT